MGVGNSLVLNKQFFCYFVLCFVQSLLFADDGRTKPKPRKGRPDPFVPCDNKCIVRAASAKEKISTVVGIPNV